MSFATRVIVIAMLLALATGYAVWLAARARNPPPSPAVPAAPAGENRYLGSESCTHCHAGEAVRHARSGHSKALASTRDSSAARRLAGKVFRDEERGSEFHYRWTANEGLTVTVPDKLGERPFPLSWAFGSGEHAVTFLTLVPNRAGDTVGIEHRVSIFGHDDRLGLTPSHAGLKATQDVEQFGRVMRGEKLERCVGCHTTTAEIEGATLVNLLANVGCERCHGPGASHVEAVAQGRDDLAILRGAGQGSADDQIRMCGECHRHPETLRETVVSPENPRLTRFQPVGLLQSACFRKSSGRMRCTTCHDPHEHALRQREEFDGRCIRCHSPDRSEPPSCRVSPRENCVECHMPEVPVRPGINFHDHWIRIHRAAPPAGESPPREPSPDQR